MLQKIGRESVKVPRVPRLNDDLPFHLGASGLRNEFQAVCLVSTMLNGKAAQYRDRAAECRQLAALTGNDDLRKQYIYLAQCYLELAEAQSSSQAPGITSPSREFP